MGECNTCPSGETCSKDKDKCMLEFNSLSNVKKIIGVMSGKGGVGKSTVSALVAKHLSEEGYKVGVLDADITGPSIPRLLGVSKEKVMVSDNVMYPAKTKDNISVMSLNLLMDESQPVIWRGPMIAGVVKQFWTDTYWAELDYLIIDMPPGTGDVALTVMQSIPIDGVVMVSIPQDMVSMIVSKAVSMAKQMNINVYGVVENMSYIKCPDCDKKIKLFSDEESDKFLQDMDLELLGELPMVKSVSGLEKNTDKPLDEDVKEVMENIASKILKKATN
ncbi:Mrp/NBP35 family ATP-binding protein [Tepidibacter hydrothermalis]|uniref:Iron-sulfur cluster carrier protein n=1 Tax=Tepidibacter hydrothermalis TaxID=3036126 RepID=A0ABY8EDM6_9FIRM|nr:Mrp/NBP35 family ATP-binding protein [Tepidibacter hydrothermalis]WFD09597.1 Mrp/NBP35 family ATP-binding protein [Tepidibacter hydrothermalis]